MESLEHILRRSVEAHNRGNLADAEQYAREALDLDSRSAQAHLVIGIIRAQSGDYDGATVHLEAVLSENPESLQAPLWLSTCYLKSGKGEEALDLARMAKLRLPQNPLAALQTGLCYLDLGLGAEAAAEFDQVIKMAPDAAQAHHGRGRALRIAGNPSEARQAFVKAVELDPTSTIFLADLYKAAMEESDAEQAAACARRILEIQPEAPEARLWLSNALLELGRPAEAKSHLMLAQEAETANGSMDYLLGWTMQSLGRIPEAQNYFRSAVANNPDHALAYAAIARNGKVTDADRAMVRRMSDLAHNPESSERERSQLYYGLGKAYEDLGEYRQAMASYDEANRIARKLKQGDRKFDRGAYAKFFDFIISTFDSKLLKRSGVVGSSCDVPIFVVGMMRSGTTLAEQILSSHSQVGAAGEQLFWTKNADRAVDRFGHLHVGELRTLADEFVRQLQAIAPGKPHVVDKMPLNYAMLGVIHLAYPRSKIIHTIRSPRDTCVSIYSTPNRSRIDWANDKSDIVFAYRQYQRLMNHWRKVLPPSSMLDVGYEKVVADQENTSRQMIEFCGLPWEESCLHPEQNDRVVVNPSVWQVRQPMYGTSIHRWKHFEPWLGAFAELPD